MVCPLCNLSERLASLQEMARSSIVPSVLLTACATGNGALLVEHTGAHCMGHAACWGGACVCAAQLPGHNCSFRGSSQQHEVHIAAGCAPHSSNSRCNQKDCNVVNQLVGDRCGREGLPQKAQTMLLVAHLALALSIAATVAHLHFYRQLASSRCTSRAVPWIAWTCAPAMRKHAQDQP